MTPKIIWNVFILSGLSWSYKANPFADKYLTTLEQFQEEKPGTVGSRQVKKKRAPSMS
jgi:hypothetical protein